MQYLDLSFNSFGGYGVALLKFSASAKRHSYFDKDRWASVFF